MNFDLSPLKDTMDNMASQFAEFIVIVLIVGFILVYLLKALKTPTMISIPITILGTLAAAYYSFIIMIG